MGAWVIASLLIVSVMWREGGASSQAFMKNQKHANNYLYEYRTPREQPYYGFYYFPKDTLQSQSASSLQPQRVKLTNTNLPVRSVRHVNYNDPVDKAQPIYEDFDANFERQLEAYERSVAHQNAEDRVGIQGKNLPKKQYIDYNAAQASTNVLATYQDLLNKGYDDHKTSQTTNVLGPHQIETIQSEHFHKLSPAYDISGFQHQGDRQKHGEVHYHQHKHIHRHEHKQEHVHQHKQDHQHKHIHNQQHKHQHQSQNHHGHQHKHDHHQQHKHDHHHQHKQDSHHQHKHDHGHKHQHNTKHKRHQSHKKY